MHLGAAGRRAILLALLCAAAPGLRAASPSPDRPFYLVQKLGEPRVIQWRAITREPGQFTLWRVDQRLERVGTVAAETGPHAYRFVDPAGSAGGFVVYRLSYEGESGSHQVLVVATVAEPGLRDDAWRGGLSASPDALPARVTLLVPPDALGDLAPAASGACLRLQPPPEPPPPRA